MSSARHVLQASDGRVTPLPPLLKLKRPRIDHAMCKECRHEETHAPQQNTILFDHVVWRASSVGEGSKRQRPSASPQTPGCAGFVVPHENGGLSAPVEIFLAAPETPVTRPSLNARKAAHTQFLG